MKDKAGKSGENQTGAGLESEGVCLRFSGMSAIPKPAFRSSSSMTLTSRAWAQVVTGPQ